MQKPGHQLRQGCLCRPARFRRRRRRPVALACREGSSSSRLPGATAGALVNTTRGREEAPRGVRNSGEVGGGAAAGGGRGSVGALGGGACAWSGQTTRRRNARDSALEGRGAAQDASRRNGADLRKWPSRRCVYLTPPPGTKRGLSRPEVCASWCGGRRRLNHHRLQRECTAAQHPGCQLVV